MASLQSDMIPTSSGYSQGSGLTRIQRSAKNTHKFATRHQPGAAVSNQKIRGEKQHFCTREQTGLDPDGAYGVTKISIGRVAPFSLIMSSAEKFTKEK